MSQHVTISANEAADRLAIRELIGAYAHCADRRDAPDGRLAALPPHVRENGWRMAVLGASAVRRLGGRARTVMTMTENQKRWVIVGATGMVGGLAQKV